MATPTTSNVARPLAFGYDVSLDDRLFRSAVGPGRTLSIETAPIEAPRVDTASSPDEIVDDFGRVFARSRFDGGEGLFRAHVEGAVPNRFWDSKGVSVKPNEPGEFPEIKLARATIRIEASTESNLWLAYDKAGLFLADGQTVKRTLAPEDDSPTWSIEDPHAGEAATGVEGLAVLGNETYAALGGNGIHRRSSGSWSHWNDLAATRVWSAKGRIMASDGRSIYEVVSSGVAPSPLKTLGPGDVWTDVVDGGSHILASAEDGHVYAFADEGGSLALVAQTFLEGEQPMSVGSAQGVVGVGTREGVPFGAIGRFWVGVLSEGGTLADMRLVREWGEREGASLDKSPRQVLASRDSFFLGIPEDTETHIWRYDLSTTGLSRQYVVSDSGRAVSLVSARGHLLVGVAESGLWRDDDTYESSGYLIGPLGDFFSASDKSWVGAILDTASLAGTEQVELYYTTDHDALNDPDSTSWISATRHTAEQVSDEVSLPNVTGRSLAGMVKLSGDGTSTPAVRSFSFRAYPSAGDGEVIATVPINISDQLERPGRHRVRARGVGAAAYADLKSTEGRSTTLRLYRVGERIRGLVENVGVPVQAVTPRGSVTTYAQVTVRGRRVGSGSTSGVGTFGTLHLFGTQPNLGEVG